MSATAVGGDRKALHDGGVSLGIALDDVQLEKLTAYLELIYVWNRAAGLTTIPRSEAVRLHCLDSLTALEFVKSGPCLDLGTGAGLPGIVLAIARPSISFTLVESNRRKCSFLLEVVRVLGLQNVSVLEGAVETLFGEVRFPVVISRAFRPPVEFLAIASRFAMAGGRIVLMLADASDQDLVELERGSGLVLESSRRLRLPRGDEARTLVCFRSRS